MNEIEVFHFPSTGHQIRTVLRDGEPWFLAREVCAVLGIVNPSDFVRSLEDDEYELVPAALVSSEARPQDFVNLVTEAGLYSLILRSRKLEARAFKRWITHEVLPSIRKTGRYEVAHQLPRTYAEALRELASTVERKEQIQRELEAAAPRAEAWDVLASAHGDYSVREASFILNRDPAIDTGQTRLFKLLREWKLIDSNDKPYAAHSTHVRLRAWSSPHPQTGEEIARKPQVRITHEGLKYLHRRLGGTDPLAA